MEFLKCLILKVQSMRVHIDQLQTKKLIDRFKKLIPVDNFFIFQNGVGVILIAIKPTFRS